MPGYTYDVFLSYRRVGTAPEWVHNHFHPLLLKCLADELDHPQVFLDSKQIQTSHHWRARLIEAHRRSRILVAVWTPSYFRSRWCWAEWDTMRKREEQLGLAVHGLVYPLGLKDGESFPPEARNTQYRDMRRWNNSVPVFSDVPEYVEFERQVETVASELVTLRRNVPEWKPDWPVIPQEPPPPDLSYLPGPPGPPGPPRLVMS